VRCRIVPRNMAITVFRGFLSLVSQLEEMSFSIKSRADLEIDDTYEYYSEEPLSCPITVYGGLQDRDISLESLRAWEEQTSADCKLRTFPGDHFFIHNPGAGFVEAFRGDVLSTLRYPVRTV